MTKARKNITLSITQFIVSAQLIMGQVFSDTDP